MSKSGLFSVFKDLPGASNFFTSSTPKTNNQSTIPSIHNQGHSDRYGNVLQYKSVLDYGDTKPFDDLKPFDDIKPFGELLKKEDLTVDLSTAAVGAASSGTGLEEEEIGVGSVSATGALSSSGVGVHPDVRRIIEEEEDFGATPGSPSNSPVINRRRDRRALKKFRETSRYSRPLRGPGTGWSPDIGKCTNLYSSTEKKIV